MNSIEARVVAAVITALLLWAGVTLWGVSISVATIRQDVKQIRENELPHLKELIMRTESRVERLEQVYGRH